MSRIRKFLGFLDNPFKIDTTNEELDILERERIETASILGRAATGPIIEPSPYKPGHNAQIIALHFEEPSPKPPYNYEDETEEDNKQPTA